LHQCSPAADSAELQRQPVALDSGRKELACVASGNIWATPIDGGAPHALTAFADAGWIVRFTWSRDGRRFAWVRADVEQDIVLLTGLRP
jgi:hypothetical protein